jgi:hypothetical protein
MLFLFLKINQFQGKELNISTTSEGNKYLYLCGF